MAKTRRGRGMKVREFLDAVWAAIPQDWQNLFKSARLMNTFKRLMRTVFFKFRPRWNGKWSAGPLWPEVFAWTALPVDQIEAIILDMKPLHPGTYSYRSIGCALGVQRRPNPHHTPDIAKVPTVWNFLRLVHAVGGEAWTPDLQDHLRNTFRNVFDSVEISSQSGVLFLQVQLVTGPKHSVRKNEDVHFWASKFVLPVVRAIGQRAAAAQRPPIPVIQMYNHELLERRLSDAPGLHVFRPSFMDMAARPPRRHIKVFTDCNFREYVEEIDVPEYEAHQRIFADIHEIITGAHKYLSLADDIQTRTGDMWNFNDMPDEEF